MRRYPTLMFLAILTLAPLATAPAASAKAKTPTVTRVSPMRLAVGQRLTVRGRNFNPRRSRNTIIFRARSGRSAFAKPSSASRRTLVVVVPAAVTRLLTGSATRFRLRVLSGRFSRWTPVRLSPVVVGRVEGAGGRPGVPGGSASPNGDCDADGIVNSTDTDDDGDLLGDTTEASLKTDACLKDTDGDGIEDGFEYRSAVDLNNDDYQEPNESLPYPGKRPYPNPLDPSDGGTDYDGDSLSQEVEQALWKFSTTAATRTLSPLTYSDGLQHSIYEHRAGQGDRRFPALAAAGYAKDAEFMAWASSRGYRDVYIDVHHPAKPAGVYRLDANLDGTESPSERLQFDRDGDGYLSDEERDEDADGLTNFEENGGRMLPQWWAKCYGMEVPYYVNYAGTDAFDPDSDGDGVRDGADDQDHDDLPNVMELSRIDASGLDDRENGQGCKLSKAIEDSHQDQTPPFYNHPSAYGRVNPFNPCLPDTSSRTCNNYPSFDQAWAPFDKSPDWYALN